MDARESLPLVCVSATLCNVEMQIKQGTESMLWRLSGEQRVCSISIAIGCKDDDGRLDNPKWLCYVGG